ncbi:MAG TPA: M23 family metallopeptidase [Solirubrobacteraceae bacterium]|nr:M23 family metallopeptidase [Solirubrobacteraceae bacterium]
MRWLLLVLAVVVVVLVLPGRAVAGGWERPVDGPVLRVFSVGGDRFAAGQHRGVDLAAPVGASVRSVCGGRVSFAGRVPRGGLTVSVRCGRLVSTYQQLGAVTVSRGQVVVPGATVGTVGSARPRPHVHLGARDRASGTYVDPLSLLAASPRALPPPVARTPLPLGPAPAGRPREVVPFVAPAWTPRAISALDHPPSTDAARLPWPVWLGLVLLSLGLPVGGAVRTRKRRRHLAMPVAQALA